MKKFILATGMAIALAAMTLAMPAFAQDDITKKLQDRIAGLSTEQQAALLLLLNQLDGSGGAASEEAKSPKDLAMEGIQGYIDGAMKGDVDAMMSWVSDGFEHYEYGDQAGLRDFLQEASDMGYLEDLEVSMEDTEVEVEDDGAVILYPVDIEGMFGAATFEYVLQKQDDGKYRIIGMDVSGI
jgi:hypothetical protein